MPARASTLHAPNFPQLGQTTPNLRPLTSPRALTSDGNASSNSGSASGADLLTRSLANTSQVNGQGGKIDIIV
ncbi:MAG: hypothetical protein HOE48_04420 [Candidatus Latescibacteria bacterium]|jgi:hypothetical protein|nr:hypothetical protein [Candidatus Latescibacterota bacterium]MBT4137134.1 hypothetical protein [Candidatus Latescibacterota bacterium]MBT5832021.1 hypothetical protein [Candidatus Latescibacterota bacterium]